ncbi:MAG TPA: (Fe-S)-binding protein [Bryobacteraceae bacterium]|nr:(Fe-S)-binding protein [Bryobacteraceae bacterium]
MPVRISLFVTCIVDQLFPKVGIAMADVLERLGCELEFREGQTCCGQPAFNSGYRDEARTVAEHFLATFDGAEHIVVPSGSCASMIAHHFSEMFPGDKRVHALEPRVWEFSQFLTDVLNVEDVGAALEATATYHDGCHSLREMRIKSGPRRLLQNVRGLRLVELDPPEECCGFGGTFSVKFPEISGAMVRTKIEAIERTGASAVISTDPSCLMQIQGALHRAGSKIRTMHLAEVLACR